MQASWQHFCLGSCGESPLRWSSKALILAGKGYSLCGRPQNNTLAQCLGLFVRTYRTEQTTSLFTLPAGAPVRGRRAAPSPCGSCLSLFVIICHTKHYHLCSSSNSTCTALHCLQEHLYEADEQAPLRQVAWDRLLQLFGDLEDSWASADGRGLFQQLPLRAVAALAKSDSLAVASENTVFAGEGVWSKAVITSSDCSVSCAWEGGKCSCADSWFAVWKFVASGVC